MNMMAGEEESKEREKKLTRLVVAYSKDPMSSMDFFLS